MTDAATTLRRMSRWRWPLIVGALLSAYLATYLALSLQGRYEATLWGLNHVKARQWVPRGFERNGDWNLTVLCVFLPPYWLDIVCWHTPARAKSGRYPVNSDDYFMYPPPVRKTETVAP